MAIIRTNTNSAVDDWICIAYCAACTENPIKYLNNLNFNRYYLLLPHTFLYYNHSIFCFLFDIICAHLLPSPCSCFALHFPSICPSLPSLHPPRPSLDCSVASLGCFLFPHCCNSLYACARIRVSCFLRAKNCLHWQTIKERVRCSIIILLFRSLKCLFL